MQRPSSIFGKRKTSADMKEAHRKPARRRDPGRRSLATIGPGRARQMDCETTGSDDPAPSSARDDGDGGRAGAEG